MNKNILFKSIIVILLVCNLTYSALIYSKINSISQNIRAINDLSDIRNDLDTLSEKFEISTHDIDFIKKAIQMDDLKNRLDVSKCHIGDGEILGGFRHGDLLFQDAATGKKYRISKSTGIKSHDLMTNKPIQVYLTGLQDGHSEYDGIEYDAIAEVVYYEYMD